jgi:hypothetical protein
MVCAQRVCTHLTSAGSVDGDGNVESGLMPCACKAVPRREPVAGPDTANTDARTPMLIPRACVTLLSFAAVDTIRHEATGQDI